jgi:hypothetical protein
MYLLRRGLSGEMLRPKLMSQCGFTARKCIEIAPNAGQGVAGKQIGGQLADKSINSLSL